MVGLVDIAPAVEKIDCGGVSVEVYGVSVRGVASLLARFPDLRKLMSGLEVEPDSLVSMAPDAVAAIIAAGVGKPGDPETEAIADRMPVDVQADLLSAILRLTMPRGLGPFADKLAKLGDILVPGQSVEAQATTLRKASKN
jgi:hypothetical protein